MKTDSKNANMQLEVILQENIELKTVTIPNMQKEFEVDLNQERDRYAELEKRFRALKEKADALSSSLDAAKNEIVRLKNMINRDSKTSSIPSSVDWMKRHKENIDKDNLQIFQEEQNSTNPVQPVDKDIEKPKAANEYNSRKPSEKKKGGQPGHEGKTLTISDLTRMREEFPDEIRTEVYEIGKTSENEGDTPRVKYVLDLDVKVLIKEYRYYGDTPIPPRHFMDVTYGDNVKATAVFCYGQCNMPTDKIGELFEAISHGMINPSDGSCYNFCNTMSGKCSGSIQQLEEDLRNSHVLYSDATVTKEGGKESYVRNVSNPDTVVYYAQDRKTIEEIQKIGVLAEFQGVLMTDHETGMKHFGKQNAECNQHVNRYCEKTTQETKNKWAAGFMNNLYEMKKDKEQRMQKGETEFPSEVFDTYSKKYDEWLQLGWRENKYTIWKTAAKDERALLRRLEKYKEDHLRFATDWEVEFTNNKSETDLRFIKGRTKMSGGFRQKSGREMCCRIMSVIRSCKKRGIDVIKSLIAISKDAANVFA